MDIYKYFMKITFCKIMPGLIKRVFISLLSFSGLIATVFKISPDGTKGIYLNHLSCITRPILIILNPDK